MLQRLVSSIHRRTFVKGGGIVLFEIEPQPRSIPPKTKPNETKTNQTKTNQTKTPPKTKPNENKPQDKPEDPNQ